MDERTSIESLRRRIELGNLQPSVFRNALLAVIPEARDAWLDRVLGLGELPDDGPELPPGCVPYLPCPVDALLRMVDQAAIRPTDVFVDVGAGAGRAAVFVHLVTGASAIGLEIQTPLVRVARDLASRLRLPRVSCVQGDAAELPKHVTSGTVFFLYCPFSGDRLAAFLVALEPLARTRLLRVCCVNTPFPPCPWLERESTAAEDLEIRRSTLHPDFTSPGGSPDRSPLP